jgi:putative ABC transport system permease protein
VADARLLWQLLCAISLPEWRAHLWRQSAAWVAVALGVAMGLSVHLVNEAALQEFGSAVRAANGQPDASLRCEPACADTVFAALAQLPQVRSAHPVVAFSSYLPGRNGQRVAVQVLGVDGLTVAAVAPTLLPRAASGQDRLALLGVDSVFANPAALAQTGAQPGDTLHLQQGVGTTAWTLAGQVGAGGGPLLVVDIAAAQQRLGMQGQLSRIDVRLVPGATADQVRSALGDQWPATGRWHAPEDEEQAATALSRAYRVNLTVLALVALFVGTFLVFSVMALSVAQRMPQFALLGVLGLPAAQRRAWVLAESGLTGVWGASVGVALGVALAQLALRWLSGDLGAGYFAGVSPQLRLSAPALLGFWALGVLAALAGGWLPARQVEALAPAQALKGLGGVQATAMHPAVSPGLLVLGVVLAQMPAVQGLPVAAYAAVACLLLGGVVGVPWVVAGLLRWAGEPTRATWLLALARARHERAAATVAVAGVVASLSLAVALTVMVSSFREGVTQWLDQVLPADLYARTATRSVASDGAYLPPGLAEQAAQLPGVLRAEASRLRSLSWAPGQPPVTLVARPLADPARQLPLVGTVWQGPVPAGLPADVPQVYVSEAMVALYQAQPGTVLHLPLPLPLPPAPGSGAEGPSAQPSPQAPAPVLVPVLVRGVWRDYARQFGTVVMDARDYVALTGDGRTNDLALWLAPGARVADVQTGLRNLVGEGGAGLMEFAVPAEIRAVTLRIFDRSFAVTHYLQVLAIAIGLFGIVASFSAQVLARRREFGLLAHLGFGRAQVRTLVAAEGAAWTAAGVVLGVALGLAVAAVLVYVVNPQSFHWSMALVVPWGRLLALCAAVMLAASLAAGLSARQAVSVQAVRAVKEDW